MLISFRVENYKSIEKEQTLSMLAGSVRSLPNQISKVGKREVLRAAAVFGSNASGKTNLIKAINAFRTLSLFGSSYIPSDDWCRINAENKDRPTSFEATVSIGNRIYTYGISIIASQKKITAEWFLDNTGSRSAEIITRKDNVYSTTELKDEERKYCDVYLSEVDIYPTASLMVLLKRMPDDKAKKLKPVLQMIKWMESKLRIIGPSPDGLIPRGSKQFDFLSRAMPSFGTGISEISFTDSDSAITRSSTDVLRGFRPILPVEPGAFLGYINSPMERFPVIAGDDGQPKPMRFIFDHSGNQFYYGEESDGTNRLFDLIPILDPDDEEDITYVIDEIDRSLHPQLTQKLFSEFGKLDPDKRRQLIATTHESRVMDLDILRRDEIWLIDKKNGVSELYSLEEFNERNDRKVDKAYLEGRYGALPCFKAIFPDLEDR